MNDKITDKNVKNLHTLIKNNLYKRSEITDIDDLKRFVTDARLDPDIMYLHDNSPYDFSEIRNYLHDKKDEYNVSSTALYTIELHDGKNLNDLNYLDWYETLSNKQFRMIEKQIDKENLDEICLQDYNLSIKSSLLGADIGR